MIDRQHNRQIYRILLVACTFAILLSALSVTGCAKYYRHQYNVNITGLDQYRGDGTTSILVPVPVMEGQLTVSARSDPVWNISIVNGSEGPMLKFTCYERNLSNISIVFSTGEGYRGLDYHYREEAHTSGVFLSPVCTVPKEYESGSLISREKYSMYSSYVWLDDNLSTRVNPDSAVISIDLRFDGSVNEAGKGIIAARHMSVNETVAPCKTGFIPVIVKVTD